MPRNRHKPHWSMWQHTSHKKAFTNDRRSYGVYPRKNIEWFPCETYEELMKETRQGFPTDEKMSYFTRREALAHGKFAWKKTPMVFSGSEGNDPYYWSCVCGRPVQKNANGHDVVRKGACRSVFDVNGEPFRLTMPVKTPTMARLRKLLEVPEETHRYADWMPLGAFGAEGAYECRVDEFEGVVETEYDYRKHLGNPEGFWNYEIDFSLFEQADGSFFWRFNIEGYSGKRFELCRICNGTSWRKLKKVLPRFKDIMSLRKYIKAVKRGNPDEYC